MCLCTEIVQLQQRKLQYVDHWRRIQFIEGNLKDRHALDACVTNPVIHLIVDISRYHIQYGACKQ